MCGYDNLIYGNAIPGLGKDGIQVDDGRLAHNVKGENGVVGDKTNGNVESEADKSLNWTCS